MIHLQGNIGEHITLDRLSNYHNSGESAFSITSPGGSLFEGWGMHDFAKANSIKEITGYGLVASAATIFMTAFPVRKGSPNSKYVIHNPQAKEDGDANKFKSIADELKAEENILINHYVNVTGKDYDTIKNIMASEKILSATEALELGLLTEIIDFKMAENVTKTDLENSMTKLLNKITNFLKVKNMVIQSADGSELEFDEGIDQISQIAVGGGLKANGSPATGEFVLNDGTIIKAEAGVITEIVPIANGDSPEMEALKAELEDAKNKLSEAQNKVSALTNELNTSKTDVQNIKTDFDKFRNEFSNYKTPGNIPTGEPSKRR